MGSETSTLATETTDAQDKNAQSVQNDAEKSISTGSEEKVNNRDTSPKTNKNRPKRVWVDYVPEDSYKIPKGLQGRVFYRMEQLDDWLKYKEKLRLSTIFKGFHKGHGSAYISNWVKDSNALFKALTRLRRRKAELSSQDKTK